MRKILFLVLLFLIATVTASCKSETTSNTVDFTAYLANTDMNGLVPVQISLDDTKIEDKIESIINILKKGNDYAKATIPVSIIISDIKVEESNVVFIFNETYNNLSPIEEIICRSSIVKSITELDTIETVEFYVGSVPYKDANGTIVGKVKHDDVVLDFKEADVQTTTKTVTLYFSDKDAMYLVPVQTEIELNSEEQLEATVLDLLIAGPIGDGLLRTIPEETKVKNVYTNEGVCYVDFSEEFVTKHMGGSTGEMLTIYSIVNTLTDLPNINKVQFLIEGTVKEEYKGHYQFNVLFEKDLDIIKK